jgi:hypothetical protein
MLRTSSRTWSKRSSELFQQESEAAVTQSDRRFLLHRETCALMYVEFCRSLHQLPSNEGTWVLAAGYYSCVRELPPQSSRLRDLTVTSQQ